MRFHTFGDNSKKTVLLIHGALTPYQIWDNAIEVFSMEYFVIVPELDAHTPSLPALKMKDGLLR